MTYIFVCIYDSEIFELFIFKQMMMRVSRLCKTFSKIKSTVQNRMVKDKAVSDKWKLVC
jgi:hypothetical protein